MDIANDFGGARNGLDNQYYDFLGIGNNKKKSKYADSAIQDLANRFPMTDDLDEQKRRIDALLAESASTLRQRNGSHGKKRTQLTGKLMAYDQYIADSKAWYDDLVKQKREADAAAAAAPPPAPQPGPIAQQPGDLAPEPAPPVVTPGTIGTGTGQTAGSVGGIVDKVLTDLGIKSKTAAGQTGTPAGQAPQQDKKNNTLLYVGIAAGVIALVWAFRRK